MVSLLTPNSQNVKSDNASNVIKHPVDNSLITLFIETNELEKMARADLVSALYGSRNYIKSKLDEHANDPPPVFPVTPSQIPNAENPFNSTPFYAGDCVFIATSGPNINLWSYASLKDVVQGLMDVTFYPYKNEVGILTFAVHHDHHGFIGSGSLSTRDAAVQGALQGSS